MEHIIEDIDEFYSDNLSEEVRFGQREVAQRGYWPGNRSPYGYNLQKVREEGGNAYHNIFVIDPLTAPIVRRIIEEAKAGHSQRDIRKGLDRDGIPPPEDPFTKAEKAKAGKWAGTTISDIVHELKYTGLIVWGLRTLQADCPPSSPRGAMSPSSTQTTGRKQPAPCPAKLPASLTPGTPAASTC